MSETKHAETDFPIQALLSRRWSPYCFADQEVATADLLALFEAARWAASSYNEQPWRYIVARRSRREAFERMLSCLVEGNQVWARHAPVLVMAVAMLEFDRNGQPNKAAIHDLGLAAGNICVEATARGLCVHQMIGILPERARTLYQIPTEAEPVTALAIGYPGNGGHLPEALRERDRLPRSRRPVRLFVFGDSWGKEAEFLES